MVREGGEQKARNGTKRRAIGRRKRERNDDDDQVSRRRSALPCLFVSRGALSRSVAVYLPPYKTCAAVSRALVAGGGAERRERSANREIARLGVAARSCERARRATGRLSRSSSLRFVPFARRCEVCARARSRGNAERPRENRLGLSRITSTRHAVREE